MAFDVLHDEKKHKFYIVIDGKEAVLDYKLVDQETLNYWRTFVPPEFRNKGIASKLVEYALNYAQQHGYYVMPTCPYVHCYMNRNPKYLTLLKDQ